MITKPLQGIGVAITRPVDQANALTQLIQAAGGEVISFPLIEITALHDYSAFDDVISNIASYDWIIFISSNAVQHSMPRLLKQGFPDHVKFAAIGPVTAQALQAFGVGGVLTPKDRFDSESLLSLPDMHDIQGKNVMIVRGVGGREVLADTLTARGANVTFAECYQRVNPQTNCQILEQAYAQQKLHMVVVTSSEAMRHLLDLAQDSTWLKHVTLCVNHARIAEQPLALGLQVRIAQAPGDAAMMQTLLNTQLGESK